MKEEKSTDQTEVLDAGGRVREQKACRIMQMDKSNSASLTYCVCACVRVPALIRSCYITPSNQQDTGVITSCSGDEGILLKK